MLRLRLRSRYTIRNTLLLFVLLPFVLIIIISGWYSLQELKTNTKVTMEQEIRLIARAIRPALSHAVQYGHNATLERTVSSAFDMDQVYGVYVYNKEGRRISAVGARAAGVQGPEAASLASLGDEQGAFDEVGGEEVFSYFMPLMDNGGRINGLLQVTRRGSDFASQLQRFRTRTLTGLMVLSLLVLAVIWVGYQRAVGRHLSSMGQGMARIAQGDIGHRIAVRGPAEIRFLSEGINAMLDSLAKSERDLRTHAERELQLKTQLHQSEKLAAIGRFAAGVAHELGTPLSVADGQAQRALRHAEDRSATAFTQIRQQLQRMERIIRQLMNFARPVQPERRLTKATDLIHSSIQQVSEEQHRQQTALALHPPEEEITLSVDRLRVEQALINLLRNALQATPGGRVDLSWERVQTRLRITVDDDGPGIDPAHQPQLFEPFFTTKGVGQGTGLGLAVVEAVMTEHGGRVHFSQSPGGGARFVLHLPIEVEELPHG